MTEPRYRYSGRRSPTSNPARASLPVGVGYSPHFSGDLHAVPTARYDAAAPRRANDHKASSSSSNPSTTITTYNVTKDPVPPPPPRTSNTARRRSSTVDSGPGPVKPIIVTTNHATRPHGTSHTSSAARPTSPSRDPYRSSDETYYTLPASSSARGQRYSHGYSQSATLSNDELRRLRERVGGVEDRLRAPTHTTDYYRYSLPHANYATPSHDLNTTAVVDYENEGYEYTKPADLARYDLDHDRQHPRGRRRESVDRPANSNYFRPTVNVVSNDPGRYDAPGRGRGPPPASSGLERYNRAAAAGIYDRPTVTMPALPPVPAAPAVEPKRRIEAPPRDPSPERRVAPRPRPVSLYQDAPARMSHPDDLYRSHDDERLHRRRDDPYLDPEVPARGFGIRTDSLKVEQPDRPARSVDRRDYDDRRVRREAAEREPRRRSDESIDYARPHDTRQSVDDTVSRDSRDSRDTLSRKGSLGGRARDKVAAGLGVAAAAMGLAPPKEIIKEDDRKVSPRRRDTIDEEPDVGSSRTADKYKSRERDVADRVERKPSPREDASVERRDSRRERAESTSGPRDREVDHELERERIRERALDRERERERGRDRDEKEREREVDSREREKERDRSRDRSHERIRQDTEAVINGSAATDKRDDSPASDNATAGTSRRRAHISSTFDPTDTRDLLDVKAELAAKDKPKEKSPVGDRSSDRDASASSSAERQSTDTHEESRGREVATTSEKQVRVVSPPRDKSEHKPIKGILKPPSAKFPEETNPIREGVAPHKDDKTKKGVPPGARWTKVNRKLINPAALAAGKERFEVRDDFVIVLRVLSKEEIQGYATATAQIRAAKRREYEKEKGSNHDYDSRDDDDKKPRRRHREYEDDYDYRRDDDRHRRYRRDDDSDDDGRGRRAIEYETSGTGRHDVRHHRATRDHDYDSITTTESRR